MVPVQSPDHFVLGRSLREFRTRRGLTQVAFGFRASLHRNYVGAIERGEINPSFRILLKLARGLDAPLSELILPYEDRIADATKARR
jgi:transcriptional regulator with XRE-family HTH domain